MDSICQKPTCFPKPQLKIREIIPVCTVFIAHECNKHYYYCHDRFSTKTVWFDFKLVLGEIVRLVQKNGDRVAEHLLVENRY